MVLSLIELLKSESDPVMSGLVENIVTVDEIVSRLPFMAIGASDHVTWEREKALPTTVTPSAGASISSDDALESDKVASFCRRFLIQQDVDVLNAGAAGGMARSRAKAIAAAAKSLARKYGTDIITGNANFTVTVNSYGGTSITGATIVVGPGHDTRHPVGVIRWNHDAGGAHTLQYKAADDAEFGASVAYTSGVKVYSDNPNKWVTFAITAGASAADGDIVFTISVTASSTPIDGMQRLVAASQTIAASGADGDNVSLRLLDQLADLCSDKSGQKVYMMNSRTRRSIVALLRALGGVTMVEASSPFFGTGRGEPIPTYNGIPLLRSDFISIAETTGATNTTGRVYCATLGEDAGLVGLYSSAAIDAADEGEIISQGANGLTVENLGTVPDKDAKRIRVKAYWGLAMKSELGLAMATGIKD